VILVTGSYLGTISHTLTALDSLYRRDMNVMAIVVSETPGSTVPLDETVAAISRFADPVIGLPRRRSPDRDLGGAAPFSRLLDPEGRRAR
jgi:dethiobiotin synthetase